MKQRYRTLKSVCVSLAVSPPPKLLPWNRALPLVLMGGPSRPCPLELPAQVLSLSLFSYCTTGVITPTCKG